MVADKIMERKSYRSEKSIKPLSLLVFISFVLFPYFPSPLSPTSLSLSLTVSLTHTQANHGAQVPDP